MFDSEFSDVHFVYMWCFCDIFNNVQVIYIRCSIMYLVMFYGVFSDVHLVYMWCSMMYWVMCM